MVGLGQRTGTILVHVWAIVGVLYNAVGQEWVLDRASESLALRRLGIGGEDSVAPLPRGPLILADRWLKPLDAFRVDVPTDRLDGLLWRGQDMESERPIETDRPDFTEASSTVPRGRLQIESGYTFTYDQAADGQLRTVHTLPEVLIRYGYTDDFEVRLAWTYVWERTRQNGIEELTDGAEDLLVGVKLSLSQQRGIWPESAMIINLGLPTGAQVFSHGHVESGVNFLYGWDVLPRWTVAGSTGFETASELVVLSLPLGTFAFREQVLVFHQSITTGFAITDKLGSYFEYFVLHIDTENSDRSDHFLNGGFTFLATPDAQYDVRVGMGLNEPADDFFTGVGYSVRR